MSEDRDQAQPTEDPDIERNVADLEQSGEKLEDAIRETKRDWEAKQSSDSASGAVDPNEDDRPGF